MKVNTDQNTFIPVNEPLLSEKVLEYVSDCVQTNWISSQGEYLELFEQKWAEYCGQNYGIAVCNGTVALELAIAACRFPAGSEIIVPSFTIISCVQAILKNHCVPVLVDCEPVTYCMNADQVQAKITERTAAIMVVHIYGHPCDLDLFLNIAEKHNLLVIEDAAEVHGAEYLSEHKPRDREDVVAVDCKKKKKYWRKCGGFGDLSCFSFYANKIVTSGEGGMVLTSDAVFAERLQGYRNLCFLNEPRFLHNELGYNFRMTNLQAAVGLAQLEQLEETIKRKIDMGQQYSSGLEKPYFQLPIQQAWAKSVIWMYAIVLREEANASKFFEPDWQSLNVNEYVKWPVYKIMRLLRDKGVQTRPFFIGMHEQPVFKQRNLFSNETYPVTEKIARTGLYLPSGQAISKQQIQQVIQAVSEVVL